MSLICIDCERMRRATSGAMTICWRCKAEAANPVVTEFHHEPVATKDTFVFQSTVVGPYGC